MSKRNTYISNELTDSSFLILSCLIYEKNGYQVMEQIKEKTKNKTQLSSSTVYPILNKFYEYDFIQLSKRVKKKKYYRITKKGKEVLNNEIERRKNILNYCELIINN